MLAEEKVNIAQMAVGRAGDQGGSAIGVLNIDDMASQEALNRLTENDSIESAQLIDLPAISEFPDWLM